MTIQIGDEHFDLSVIKQILAGPVQVTLTDEARRKIEKSAATVQRLLQSGDALWY